MREVGSTRRDGWGPAWAAGSGAAAGLWAAAVPGGASGVVPGVLALAALAPLWAAWEVVDLAARPPGGRLRATRPGRSIAAGVSCGALALGLCTPGPPLASAATALGAASLLLLLAVTCAGVGLIVWRLARSAGLGAVAAASFGGSALGAPILIAPWADALSPAAQAAVLRLSPLTAFPAALAGTDLLKSEALYRVCRYAQTHAYALPATTWNAGQSLLWIAVPVALLAAAVTGRQATRSA